MNAVTVIQPTEQPAPAPAATRAASDDQLISIWLDTRAKSPNTRRAYEREAARFLAHVDRSLRELTMEDVIGYRAALQSQGLKPATVNRSLAAVKSLLGFGHRVGYLPFNVGAHVEAVTRKDDLAARILPEADVIRLIDAAGSDRNRVIMEVLYVTGARVSELCGLTGADLAANDDGGGTLTVYGKGGKTRAVRIHSPRLWFQLTALATGPNEPVFRSRTGRALHTNEIRRVIQSAARRAGIDRNVSPHWLRHAHASHAMDRGAALHLVQSTLGHASPATTGRYLHARPGESSGKFLAVG